MVKLEFETLAMHPENFAEFIQELSKACSDRCEKLPEKPGGWIALKLCTSESSCALAVFSVYLPTLTPASPARPLEGLRGVLIVEGDAVPVFELLKVVLEVAYRSGVRLYPRV